MILVFVDGFSKEHTPGSLREPAATYLFPSNWLTLPLSLGLLMCMSTVVTYAGSLTDRLKLHGVDIASSQTCIAICDTHGNTRNRLTSHTHLRLAFSVGWKNTSNEIDLVFTLRKPGDCWDLNVRRTNP